MRRLPAMTLIELVLVMAIVAIVSVSSILAISTMRTNQALTSSAEKLKTLLTQAHIYSRESKDDRAWGISRQDDSTYRLRSRTSSLDPSPANVSEYPLEQPITFVTPTFDIWFSRGTGNTQPTTIILSSPSGRSARITINSAGVVEILP